MSDSSKSPTASEATDMSTSSSTSNAGWLNERSLSAVLHDQREMLSKLEKANETLETCNSLSAQRLETYVPEFRQHVKLLGDTKKDLDSVYRRLRLIQAKISKLYPKEYAEARNKAEMSEEPEDEE
ncbi:hypothetical protein RvY_16981 [Ramazzottius varieornatus]|uniref:KxDL domain-containing protein n=1 Tax=Ramazzottius varieornatus TaxID=947166 RepID=A0A1D1W0H0_RAMVA|nr:hypothetical protein RvY_16981 [Ramazzottius varieornatus]